MAALRPGRVLAAAVGWTWAWLGLAVVAATLTGGDWLDPPVLAFVGPGLAGPFLVALAASRRLPRPERRRLWGGLVDPRGIAPRWWAAVIAVALGPKLVAWVAGIAAGEVVAGAAVAGAGAVAGIAGFALLAGFGEEPLWRGVAREASQARSAPLPAALLVGVAWAAWHLPLYFLPGTYQHGLGAGSVEFGLAVAGQVAGAVLLVWLTNGAGGRVLVAAVAHAVGNAAGEILPASTWTAVAELLVVILAVMVVVGASRGRLGLGTSGRRPPRHAAADSLPAMTPAGISDTLGVTVAARTGRAAPRRRSA